MHADPHTESPASQRHPLEFPANALASVGTVWIFLIMALVVADVIGRSFLNQPITGVAEFSSRSVGAIVFLQLAAAVCSNRMTRSDFLLNLIGKRSAKGVVALNVFNALVGAGLFTALAWIGWSEFSNSWESNEFYGVQGVYSVPAWPFRGLLVAGSAAGALCYLLSIPGILKQPGSTSPADDPLGGGA